MEFGHTLNIVGNLIWKSPWWWVGFNEGDLEIFRPEVWNFEILNFEEFFSVYIQLDYKRWLYNEKLVGWPVHTWASGTVYTMQDLKSPSVSALFHLHLKQGVCHTVALSFTWKSILMQKKNYGNSNITPCNLLKVWSLAAFKICKRLETWSKMLGSIFFGVKNGGK